MFWGLIMEPNKRYSQLVERSFHLSMASLDVTGANDQPVQVMLCYENRNYLLCTLKKGTIFQVPLDLNFQEGTKIAFTCNGFGHVHLTGYLTLDEDLDFGDLEEEEEDDEEAPQLVKPKRKAVESPVTKASKKLKKQANDDEDSSEDDDLDGDAESDSDDEDQSKLVGADDDEDESEDDSDDDDEDDDSEDEAEPEQEVVAKSNKQKQKQNQQQAQNQVGKKQEKQKLVNGKDSSKQDLSKQKKNKSEQQQQQQQQQQNTSQQSKKRTIEGGVVVEDLVVGNGAPAKPGKGVSVYYVGRLKNGKKFDETRQGDGFRFQLGKGEVIKGWDVGISGMKIGGKRRLTIPAAMGYGNKGSPPVIPGNSTLIFDVELKKVH